MAIDHSGDLTEGAYSGCGIREDLACGFRESAQHVAREHHVAGDFEIASQSCGWEVAGFEHAGQPHRLLIQADGAVAGVRDRPGEQILIVV